MGFASHCLCQVYDNGTECDLTGTPRKVELQVKCGVETLNTVTSIKERSTCEYIVELKSPLICGHPLFVHSESPAEDIDCFPIAAEDPDVSEG